jgi:hypothetical protein
MPKGDHKPNLNPHIPFIPPKRDDKSSQPAVEIMILNKDLRKKAMKDSTERRNSQLLRPLPVAPKETERTKTIFKFPEQH